MRLPTNQLNSNSERVRINVNENEHVLVVSFRTRDAEFLVQKKIVDVTTQDRGVAMFSKGRTLIKEDARHLWYDLMKNGFDKIEEEFYIAPVVVF